MDNNYKNIEDFLKREDPRHPVYCIYPFVYRRTTLQFIEGFPGRVLYAIKANDHPEIIKLLYGFGIRHFDCASLVEIRQVHELCPAAKIYFMNPVRFNDDARIAHEQYGVRHFVIDHHSGLAPLVDEIEPAKIVIFARMAVSHHSASQDLSYKFGAAPEDIPSLLSSIKDADAEPALAFNVGTGVRSPAAYAHAISVTKIVLNEIPFKIRLLDMGGGFPRAYPGFKVPAIDDFLGCISQLKAESLLNENGELMCEPGRALSAPGLSAVTRVLLRKPDKIYLNDGMYGAFWELRCKGHLQYPCRVFRNGQLLVGEEKEFRVFGPTCDSSDEFPTPVALPVTIAVGDHIEFGTIGAYSLSGRTNFNGFYSDKVISFTDEEAQPPLIEACRVPGQT